MLFWILFSFWSTWKKNNIGRESNSLSFVLRKFIIPWFEEIVHYTMVWGNCLIHEDEKLAEKIQTTRATKETEWESNVEDEAVDNTPDIHFLMKTSFMGRLHHWVHKNLFREKQVFHKLLLPPKSCVVLTLQTFKSKSPWNICLK